MPFVERLNLPQSDSSIERFVLPGSAKSGGTGNAANASTDRKYVK